MKEDFRNTKGLPSILGSKSPASAGTLTSHHSNKDLRQSTHKGRRLTWVTVLETSAHDAGPCCLAALVVFMVRVYHKAKLFTSCPGSEKKKR